MIRSIINFLTVETTQNELPLGGVEQPSQRTPGGGGVNNPPMGVYLKCMIGGVCTKSWGFMDPRRGGVENTLPGRCPGGATLWPLQGVYQQLNPYRLIPYLR